MSPEFSIVRPEIPHNTGAIGRLCVGLGVGLHLIRPLGFRLDDQSVARAGLDYWPYLDLRVHDTWEDYLAAERPNRVFFLTHGHLWNEDKLPPVGIGTVLAHGHTHIPELKKRGCGMTIFNPGSVSLPKGGTSRSFGCFDGETLKHYVI